MIQLGKFIVNLLVELLLRESQRDTTILFKKATKYFCE